MQNLSFDFFDISVLAIRQVVVSHNSTTGPDIISTTELNEDPRYIVFNRYVAGSKINFISAKNTTEIVLSLLKLLRTDHHRNNPSSGALLLQLLHLPQDKKVLHHEGEVRGQAQVLTESQTNMRSQVRKKPGKYG